MPAGVAERSGADLGNCGSERRAKPVPCSISLQLDDPRTSLGWVDPPVLIGAGVVLRPFDEADAPRIVHCLLRPANPAVAGVVAVAVRAGGGEGLSGGDAGDGGPADRAELVCGRSVKWGVPRVDQSHWLRPFPAGRDRLLGAPGGSRRRGDDRRRAAGDPSTPKPTRRSTPSSFGAPPATPPLGTWPRRPAIGLRGCCRRRSRWVMPRWLIWSPPPVPEKGVDQGAPRRRSAAIPRGVRRLRCMQNSADDCEPQRDRHQLSRVHARRRDG